MGRERASKLIVVDTSALMSIYVQEADAQKFEHALFVNRTALIAAPTALEFVMVARSRRPGVSLIGSPDSMLTRPGVRIEGWTERHLTIAQQAFTKFGKGQGHPAQLDFGDCISYALAKSLDAPLLYKGEDFARTDIRAAV